MLAQAVSERGRTDPAIIGAFAMTQWQRSFKSLKDVIPPPVHPRYVDGPVLDPSLPALPADHAELILANGSGEFSYGEIGCVFEVFSPRDPWHKQSHGDMQDAIQFDTPMVVFMQKLFLARFPGAR